MRTLIISSTISLLAFGSPVLAGDLSVSQTTDGFSTKMLKAKVGDVVAFKNDDRVFHNVFSLSDAQSFDLGAYGPGIAKKLKVEKAGKIDVECAIHPGMTMVIDVSR